MSPVAWMVRQSGRTYYVSDAEFCRSSYDAADMTPLYGPDAPETAIATERERCARIVERVNGWLGVREIAAEIRGASNLLKD